MSNFLPEPMDIDTPPVSTMSMLRCLGEQDHGSYNGTQSRENALARNATAVADPSYFQLGLESATQDANRCVVCSAQFSTREKLRGHVWFYQVRMRRHAIEVI